MLQHTGDDTSDYINANYIDVSKKQICFCHFALKPRGHSFQLSRYIWIISKFV